jgi:serine/threonine protein kinase
MTIVGTYGYMPPEQFSGRAFPASDLYSLGATLIYLVTGTHPADLLQEDLLLEFEPVVHLSPSFVQWLKLLTHPNRKQRLTSATVALKALEQPFVESQPIESSTTSTPLTLQKPVYSRISLHKDAETLEIYLPPKDTDRVSNCRVLMCLLYTFCWLMGFLFSLLSGNWLIVWLCLFLLGCGIYGQYEAFFTRADTRIHIDQTSMTVTQTASGRRRQLFQASRNSLYRLTYSKRYYYATDGGYMQEPPALRIWASQDAYKPCYSIGKALRTDPETKVHGYLTTQELDWLAQELSDWLGLPITRE